MNLRSLPIPVIMIALCAACQTAPPETKGPAKPERSSKERAPDKGQKYDPVRESYNSYPKLRAAKILQKVRFKGDYETNHSYIEFSDESNFIYIKFDGDYRQGKITSLGKTGTDASEGAYSIQTWKPQNYVGHRRGPSRANFKSFYLKWKVTRVESSEFSGRVLHLRVLANDRYGSGKLKQIHDFKLREKKRGY